MINDDCAWLVASKLLHLRLKTFLVPNRRTAAMIICQSRVSTRVAQTRHAGDETAKAAQEATEILPRMWLSIDCIIVQTAHKVKVMLRHDHRSMVSPIATFAWPEATHCGIVATTPGNARKRIG